MRSLQQQQQQHSDLLPSESCEPWNERRAQQVTRVPCDIFTVSYGPRGWRAITTVLGLLHHQQPSTTSAAKFYRLFTQLEWVLPGTISYKGFYDFLLILSSWFLILVFKLKKIPNRNHRKAFFLHFTKTDFPRGHHRYLPLIHFFSPYFRYQRWTQISMRDYYLGLRELFVSNQSPHLWMT